MSRGRPWLRIEPGLLCIFGVTALILAVLFGPAFTGDRVLASQSLLYTSPIFAAEAPPDVADDLNTLLADAVFAYHPLLEFDREQIRSGAMPSWNPNIGAGRPLGAAQGAPFFPTSLPMYILSFWQSLIWVAAAKFLIAGLGVYLLCRRFRLATGAAVLGAIAFAFSTYFVALLDAGQALAYMTLPFCLLFADRLLERPRAPSAIALGLAGGLIMLNGHPESAALALATVAIFVAFKLAGPRAAAGRPRLGRLLALAASISAGVGAVAILPLAELLTVATGAQRGGGDQAVTSLSGATLPNFWGRDDTLAFNSAPVHFAGRAFYVGALALLIAVAGFSLRRSREQAFFGILAVLLSLIVVDTPIKDAVELIPGVRIVELTSASGILVLSLCILAAFGFDRFLRCGLEQRRALLKRAAVLALLPLTAVVIEPQILGAIGDALTPAALLGNDAPSLAAAKLASVLRWALFAGLGIAALALTARSSRWPAVAAIAAVALVGLDLTLIDRGYRSTIEEAVADPPPPVSVAALKDGSSHARVGGGGTALHPNLASTYGLRDLRAEDLPAIERYLELYTELGGDYTELFGSTTVDLSSPAAGKLLSAFAVEQVVAEAGELPPQGYRRSLSAEGQQVFTSSEPHPRAAVAEDWRVAEDLDEALSGIAASPAAKLERSPLIEGAAAAPTAPSSRRMRAPEAKIVRDDPTAVSIEVDSAKGGYLILHDSFYPGWSAEVDGEEAEIDPANVAFRAVRVPAGASTVEFRYHPVALIAGAAITVACTLTSVLALAILMVRRRREG